jgi:DNA-binding CsgD family transcriptional regulator
MRIEDSDILVDLYRGAGQMPPWQGFLTRVGDRATAMLLIQSDGTKSPDFHWIGGDKDNPPFAQDALLRMRYQRVYAGEELSGPRAYLFARALRVRVDGGGDLWLIVGRDGSEFSAAFTLMISGLVPHLGMAAASYLAQCRLRDHLGLADHIAQKFQTGVLTLNTAGTILTASPLAEQLLANTETIFGQIGSKLGLPFGAAKILADTLQTYESGLDSGAVALQIPSVHLLIQPYFGADYLHQNPTAIVHLRQHMPRAANVAKCLAKMAQITLSEARFALKLVEGMTISEAAAALGLTLETARNYSKQIYAKTDLRGQSDLIRYVQNSVIPLI